MIAPIVLYKNSEVLAKGSTPYGSIVVAKEHPWDKTFYTISNGRQFMMLSPEEWELFKAVVRLADLEETEGGK